MPDISDRELNTILTLISLSKGHRITVILDCCHSGGVSRSLPEPGVRTSPRMARATFKEILVAGDKTLKHHTGYRSILARDWLLDMNSHVFVAACKEYQHAKEKKVKREDRKMARPGILEYSRTCLCVSSSPATGRRRRHTLILFIGWIRRLTRRSRCWKIQRCTSLVSGLKVSSAV